MPKKKEEMRLTPAAAKALNNGDIINFIVAAIPGGIEAQEAAGQKVLVNNELLPLDGIDEVAMPLRITYEKDVVDGIFVKASLPIGWKKVAAPDHSMWSYIVDETGKKRAGIFYKAAFYDRRAYIRLEE
jgi:hypothetical protein